MNPTDESSLVGLALMRPATTARVDLEPEDFRDSRLGYLWGLLRRLLQDGKIPNDESSIMVVADLVTHDPEVGRRLERGGDFLAWWTALPEEVVSYDVNPATYADRIRQRNLNAGTVQTFREMVARVREGSDPAELADDLEALATRLRRSGTRVSLDTDAPPVGSLLGDALDIMRARATGEPSARPFTMPDGWTLTSAELGGGLSPGWMYVLVGNTGTGKSQWALQAALAAARGGTPVLYVGLELDRVGLVTRLLGLLSHIHWSRLYLGESINEQPPAEEATRLMNLHAGTLEALPLHLEVGPPYGWDYTRLRPMVDALCRRYPGRPPLVVVDYLQLVTSPKGSREETRERVGKVAYQARQVARDASAAVLLLSSTGRQNYATLAGQENGNRLGTGPADWLVGLGKESGEVEYAADAVLVLAKDPNGSGEKESRVFLAIAKRRARPMGSLPWPWVPYRFNGGWFMEEMIGRSEPVRRQEDSPRRKGSAREAMNALARDDR
jgi:replicative DNA helicase